jgi:hypothetical protein
MSNGNYQIKLHPRQAEVYNDPHRFRVVVAGRRFGKCADSCTPILMANGSYKQVKDLVAGDMIMTCNETTLKLEPKPVVQVADNGIRETLEIETNRGQKVCVTPNHPILSNSEWIDAGDLKVRDLVAVPKQIALVGADDSLAVTGDFAWVEVKSIKPAGASQTYDLQVEDNHNFIAGDIVTHNSYLATAELIRAASKPRSINWYVAPTYAMCRTIIWRQLQDLVPKQWVAKVHDTRLEITLVNGAQICLRGSDSPDSLRGVGLDFLVMDEVQDIDKEAWTAVLRPTLAVSQGRALFIGTPKGYQFLYDLFSMAAKNDEWVSWQFKTIDSPFISESEIEAARQDMDDKLFAQEMLASFEQMSGRVAHAFDRRIHVRPCPFNPELPIWVGLDFNLDPMSCAILQRQKDGSVWVVDEITRFDSNVMDMCDQLDARFWRWINNIIVYPDPAGGQRQHGRGESSFQILQERGFRNIRHRKRTPAISDRVNSANRMLMNAKGEPKLFFDPSCARVIQAFEQTTYKEGTNEIDKRQGVDHHFDCTTYCLEYEFPVRKLIATGVSL